MATHVIKKDGSEQPFDADKMKRSIEAACNDAQLGPERTSEVAEQVAQVALDAASGKEKIATSELKTVIFSELDRVEPLASAAWRKHAETKGASA